MADYFGVTLGYLFGRSRVRFDLAVLNRPMYHEKTMGDLVMSIDGMQEEQRRAAVSGYYGPEAGIRRRA